MRNFKPLAIFCGCTAQFVSDLVGNPEDRFSHNEARIVLLVHYEIETSDRLVKLFDSLTEHIGMSTPLGVTCGAGEAV